ncbi:hypothetical protein BKA66DRAFT_435639, partial [Pyrenochaeta sp. MPI-SDFR-AT-0127]
IKQYIKYLRTQKRQPSWIYKYGYRVASLKNLKRIFFVCRHCHLKKSTHNHIFDITSSVSAAARHLGMNRPGHRLCKDGKVTV